MKSVFHLSWIRRQLHIIFGSKNKFRGKPTYIWKREQVQRENTGSTNLEDSSSDFRDDTLVSCEMRVVVLLSGKSF